MQHLLISHVEFIEGLDILGHKTKPLLGFYTELSVLETLGWTKVVHPGPDLVHPGPLLVHPGQS